MFRGRIIERWYAFFRKKKIIKLAKTYIHQQKFNGYYPLVCYDWITDNLIKIQLRDETQYSCTGVIDFLQHILDEYLKNHLSINMLLRGDSGFATPELYKQCEKMELDDLAKENKVDYAVVYGEFMYRAGLWSYERRVVCKVEKPKNKMTYMYTFLSQTWIPPRVDHQVLQ